MRKEELQQNATMPNEKLHDETPPPSEKNASAQRLIKAMGQPSHVTPDDIKFLIKVIKEAKQPTRISRPAQSVLAHGNN